MIDWEMRRNIHPLCDKCNHPMNPYISPWTPGLGVDRPVEVYFAYKCSNCARLYDIGEGYFSIINEQMQLEGTLQHKCRKDGRSMYIAELNSETSQVVWRCAFRECEWTETRTGILLS
jgi:hypothetical protein